MPLERRLPTDAEQALWDLMGRHKGLSRAITQEEAGRRLGIHGKPDSVRRKVQKLRDGLLDTGRLLIATSSDGMCRPATEAERDIYFDEVFKRSLGGFLKAAKIDRLRVAGLARDLLTEVEAVLAEADRQERVAQRERCTYCRKAWAQPDSEFCAGSCSWMAEAEEVRRAS